MEGTIRVLVVDDKKDNLAQIKETLEMPENVQAEIIVAGANPRLNLTQLAGKLNESNWMGIRWQFSNSPGEGAVYTETGRPIASVLEKARFEYSKLTAARTLAELRAAVLEAGGAYPHGISLSGIDNGAVVSIYGPQERRTTTRLPKFEVVTAADPYKAFLIFEDAIRQNEPFHLAIIDKKLNTKKSMGGFALAIKFLLRDENIKMALMGGMTADYESTLSDYLALFYSTMGKPFGPKQILNKAMEAIEPRTPAEVSSGLHPVLVIGKDQWINLTVRYLKVNGFWVDKTDNPDEALAKIGNEWGRRVYKAVIVHSTGENWRQQENAVFRLQAAMLKIQKLPAFIRFFIGDVRIRLPLKSNWTRVYKIAPKFQNIIGFVLKTFADIYLICQSDQTSSLSKPNFHTMTENTPILLINTSKAHRKEIEKAFFQEGYKTYNGRKGRHIRYYGMNKLSFIVFRYETAESAEKEFGKHTAEARERGAKACFGIVIPKSGEEVRVYHNGETAPIAVCARVDEAVKQLVQHYRNLKGGDLSAPSINQAATFKKKRDLLKPS